MESMETLIFGIGIGFALSIILLVLIYAFATMNKGKTPNILVKPVKASSILNEENTPAEPNGDIVYHTYLPIVMAPEPPAPPSPRRMEYFTMTTPWGARMIRVNIPEGYDNSGKEYPVLYLTDGQAYATKPIANFIIVGIDSVSATRWDELSPWQNKQMEQWFGLSSPKGGSGEQFLSFVLEVKTAIDNMYRTLPDNTHTAIGGASMGGMFAIYASIERSDVFSKAIVFSPAVWFGSRDIYNWLSKNNMIDYINANSHQGVDFWIYVGGKESHDHESSISPCPAVGYFPTIYYQGANKVHDMLGGELVYNPNGTHFVSVFLNYFPQAFTWLGW